MATKEEILEALKTVVDPELGINVVDLGLIYGVEVDDKSVRVTMTLTTHGCPLHESMAAAVQNVIRMVELTKEIHVDLVWEPAWNPTLMTDNARRLLGW